MLTGRYMSLALRTTSAKTPRPSHGTAVSGSVRGRPWRFGQGRRATATPRQLHIPPERYGQVI